MERMNLGHYLDSVTARLPEKTALIYSGQALSYRAFQNRVNRLAAALHTRGVRRRDAVGLCCHNSSQYLEVVFACARLGAVCVQYNWRLSAMELERLVARSQPVVMFFSARFPEIYEQARPLCRAGLEWYAVGGALSGALEYECLLDALPLEEGLWEGGGEDILLQIYTSGTTGEPKGVMLSHRAVVSHALCNIKDCRWQEDDVFPCVLPLFHASASGTYNTLLSGGTVVVHERFCEERYLESIQTHRATRLSLTPTMLKSLLRNGRLPDCDLSAVRCIVYGAAPISAAVLRRAVEVFRCDFYQLYGMTEMAPTVAVLQPEDHRYEGSEQERRRLSSVGRPATGVLIRLVDQAGNTCPPRATGEILVRGDGMMTGYQKLAEKTEQALRGGWYHTGDLGHFDEDGYLYVTGRISDVIITGEENVCAGEVETCIRQMEAVVQEVAVIGLPDERWGEIVAAAVICCPGTSVTEGDIIAHCRSRIAGYKKPRRVLFVEQLPLNSCGKVIKKELRKMFEDASNNA